MMAALTVEMTALSLDATMVVSKVDCLVQLRVDLWVEMMADWKVEQMADHWDYLTVAWRGEKTDTKKSAQTATSMVAR